METCWTQCSSPDDGREDDSRGQVVHRKAWIAGALLATSLTAGLANAGDVEVLRWWISGGGKQIMTILRDRVTAGSTPTAAQMTGLNILDWAKEIALLT